MVSLTNITPDTIVTLVPDTPLLSKAERVVVIGVGGYNMALMTSTDVDARHAEVLSSIETPDVETDIRKCTFLIVENRDGEREAWANVWLKNVSVVEELRADFSLVLENLDELAAIKKVLQSLGHTPEIVVRDNMA